MKAKKKIVAYLLIAVGLISLFVSIFSRSQEGGGGASASTAGNNSPAISQTIAASNSESVAVGNVEGDFIYKSQVNKTQILTNPTPLPRILSNWVSVTNKPEDFKGQPAFKTQMHVTIANAVEPMEFQIPGLKRTNVLNWECVFGGSGQEFSSGPPTPFVAYNLTYITPKPIPEPAIFALTVKATPTNPAVR